MFLFYGLQYSACALSDCAIQTYRYSPDVSMRSRILVQHEERREVYSYVLMNLFGSILAHLLQINP